jgi:dTDP-4-amino-4,6-dideoxygalactose transaminase
MISFHPTFSPQRYTTPSHRGDIRELFPHHATILTDSGRSALALAIETLGLSDKTVALPAFVCDALLPILIRYNITPVFLDVEKETYHPNISHYVSVVNRIDGAILVATFGAPLSTEVVTFLKKHGKIIIEDYAHVPLPTHSETISGDARIYSLPKTLPVPDGGLAVLPTQTNVELRSHIFSLSYVKNVLKLLPLVAPIVASIRNSLRFSKEHIPPWSCPMRPSTLTSFLLPRTSRTKHNEFPYKYCHPFLVKDPERAIKLLREKGISAERIWHHPLILHKEAQRRFNLSSKDYPITTYIAEHIVCVPLWHISNKQHYQKYLENLQKVLAHECTK